MSNERTILHSDMNSFYASVEMMLNPSLRGKAVAVCGATEDRHGIVLAKSEKAKKAGVKTGMVNWEAKKLCPDLVLVPPQYEQYLKFSKLAHQIYYRYTDLVEPYGMDECWLDVSGHIKTGLAIAEEIRKATREELGLTVSIGVSFNKIFAKLGSDMKKPDAVTEITKDNFKEKVWPLSASEMIYVGPATSRKLNSRCIYTIGELAACNPELLERWFGINGIQLWRYANGTDESRVMHKDFVSPVKSIGHGITCTANLISEEDVWKVMLQLTQDIGHKLRLHKLKAAGVQVFVRTKDLNYYQFQTRLGFKTQLPNEIASAAFGIFKQKYIWNMDIRAVTVRAIDLEPQDEAEQVSMFVDYNKICKNEQVQDAIEEIRSRFGKGAVKMAVLLGDLKMPGHHSQEIIMPGMMYR
ncbi:MAG: DNA polymerase IV [Ruminiclostridium sp.]